MTIEKKFEQKTVKRVFNSMLAVLLVFTLCIPSVGLQAMSENARAFADSVTNNENVDNNVNTSVSSNTNNTTDNDNTTIINNTEDAESGVDAEITTSEPASTNENMNVTISVPTLETVQEMAESDDVDVSASATALLDDAESVQLLTALNNDESGALSVASVNAVSNVSAATQAAKVYRLNNPLKLDNGNDGLFEHLYTVDANEVKKLISTEGWKDDSASGKNIFYTPTEDVVKSITGSETNAVPVYRMRYDYYGTDPSLLNHIYLVDTDIKNWTAFTKEDKASFYAAQYSNGTAYDGAQPVYRLYHPLGTTNAQDMLLTQDLSEAQNLVNNGEWQFVKGFGNYSSNANDYNKAIAFYAYTANSVLKTHISVYKTDKNGTRTQIVNTDGTSSFNTTNQCFNSINFSYSAISNYTIKSATLNDVEQDLSSNTSFAKTITSPWEHQTLVIELVEDKDLTMTVENGKINYSGAKSGNVVNTTASIKVPDSSEVDTTYTGNTGYHLDSVSVTDETAGLDDDHPLVENGQVTDTAKNAGLYTTNDVLRAGSSSVKSAYNFESIKDASTIEVGYSNTGYQIFTQASGLGTIGADSATFLSKQSQPNSTLFRGYYLNDKTGNPQTNARYVATPNTGQHLSYIEVSEVETDADTGMPIMSDGSVATLTSNMTYDTVKKTNTQKILAKDLSNNSYTFGTVDRNYAIKAYFEINTYSIDTLTTNGIIKATTSHNADGTYNWGTSPVFQLTANTGYHLVNAIINGVTYGIVSNAEFALTRNKLTFLNLNKDYEVEINYVKNKATNEGLIYDPTVENYRYVRIFSIDPKTSITTMLQQGKAECEFKDDGILYVTLPVGLENKDIKVVVYESNKSTAVPNKKVNVDGRGTQQTGTDGSTTFYVDRVITTSATNGTIDNDKTVEYGEDATINYQANEHYHLDAITLDGKKVAVGTNNDSVNVKDDRTTFKNVTKFHTLNVVFEANGSDTGDDGKTEKPIYDTETKRKMDVTVTATDPKTGKITPVADAYVEVIDGKITVALPDGLDSKDITVKAVFADNQNPVVGRDVVIDGRGTQKTDTKGTTTFYVDRVITTSATNGTIDDDKTVKYGADATINYQANKHYHFEAITLDGKRVPIGTVTDLINVSKNKTIFKNVKDFHTLAVVFVTNVTQTDPIDGKTNPPAFDDSTDRFVDVTITATDPKTGDVKPVGSDYVEIIDGQINIKLPDDVADKDITVKAEFTDTKEAVVNRDVVIDGRGTQKTDTKGTTTFYVDRVITTSATNGTIDDDKTVKYGADATINYQANEHYHLDAITLDGKKVAVGTNNDSVNVKDDRTTFKNVTKFHTLNVVFEANGSDTGDDGKTEKPIYDTETKRKMDVTVTATDPKTGKITPVADAYVEVIDGKITVALPDGLDSKDITVKAVFADNQNPVVGRDVVIDGRGTQQTDTTGTTTFYVDRVITTSATYGTIDDDVTVTYGDDATVNYQANDRYHLEAITLDGETIPVGTNNDALIVKEDRTVFKNVTKFHTLDVTFKANGDETDDGGETPPIYDSSRYAIVTVTATNPKTGTTTPVANTYVEFIDGKLTVKLPDGYDAKDITVKAIYEDTKEPIVNRDVVIDGRGTQQTDTTGTTTFYVDRVITTSATYGTIDDDVTVKYGDSATINYKADEHYHFEAITLDGETIPVGTSNNLVSVSRDKTIFKNVTKFHTLDVTFVTNVTKTDPNTGKTNPPAFDDSTDRFIDITITATDPKTGVVVPVGSDYVEIIDGKINITVPEKFVDKDITVKAEYTDTKEPVVNRDVVIDGRGIQQTDTTGSTTFYVDRVVTTSATNGTIDDDKTVTYGADATINYQANKGYHLDNVKVVCENLGEQAVYTLTDDVALLATFESVLPDGYNATVTATKTTFSTVKYFTSVEANFVSNKVTIGEYQPVKVWDEEAGKYLIVDVIAKNTTTGDTKRVKGTEIEIVDGVVQTVIPRGYAESEIDVIVKDATDKSPIADKSIKMADINNNPRHTADGKDITGKDGIAIFPPANQGNSDKGGEVDLINPYDDIMLTITVTAIDPDTKESTVVPNAFVRIDGDGFIYVVLPTGMNYASKDINVNVVVKNTGDPVENNIVHCTDNVGNYRGVKYTDAEGNALFPAINKGKSDEPITNDDTDKKETTTVVAIDPVDGTETPVPDAEVEIKDGKTYVKLPDGYDNKDIRVTVKDENGNPIANRVVSIDGRGEQTTDADGNALFLCGRFTITTTIENGTITPTEENIIYGEKRYIAYSADDGYEITRIEVDGVEVDVSKNQDGYTFAEISANHDINVVCEYADAGAGAGSQSSSGDNMPKTGDMLLVVAGAIALAGVVACIAYLIARRRARLSDEEISEA